jgi:hypothetical protein
MKPIAFKKCVILDIPKPEETKKPTTRKTQTLNRCPSIVMAKPENTVNREVFIKNNGRVLKGKERSEMGRSGRYFGWHLVHLHRRKQ